MTSTPPSKRVFSITDSQTICTKTFNYVINFAKVIDDWIPAAGFLQPMTKLDELKSRIEQAKAPFLTESEYSGYIVPILNKIIFWRTPISNQLKKFWEAQNEIGNVAASDVSNPQYNPMDKAIEVVEEMVTASKIYLQATDKVVKNPKERLFLYALFHSHILRTETAEYAFRRDMEVIINRFNLQTKYDVNEIFSVEGKVPNRNGGFNTDARAIRDAFAHFQYKIVDVGSSWEIEFLTTRSGFSYSKKFTEKEFLTFMENTDLLYKSMLHLIWLYVGSSAVANAFII